MHKKLEEIQEVFWKNSVLKALRDLNWTMSGKFYYEGHIPTNVHFLIYVQNSLEIYLHEYSVK